MESIQETFETVADRIKSPVIGPIILAYFVFNWKPIYYLIFAEQSVEIRFEYFDRNTDIISCFVLPTFFGLAFALAAPWIAYWFAYLSEKPARKQKEIGEKNAHELSKFKSDLQQERSRRETALVDAEIELQEKLKKIEDKEAQNKLKSEINRGRISEAPAVISRRKRRVLVRNPKTDSSAPVQNPLENDE